MSGYSRQSAASIVPTAVVRATPLNDEFNALRDAFVVASGHKHDGTATEGAYVPLISDTNARNKVVIDSTNNRVQFFVSVSSSAVEQVRIADGAIVPVTDNDIDLGTSSLEFKDLYIDGTANIDSLVADTAAISAGNINNTVIGNSTPAAGTFTTLGVNSSATIASAAISAGTINNTVIGNTTAQAITGTTVTATTGFVGGVTGNVTGNLTGNVTGDVTGNITGNVTGNVTASSGTSTFTNVTINGTLDMNAGSAGTITGLPTPSNNSDAAPKSYVDTSISNLIGTAPSTLDTLGEIADALNDDANLAATLTNSIATKVSKAGDSMTGALAMGANKITGLGTPSADTDASTKGYVDTQRDTRLALAGGTMSGAIAMGTNKITGLGDPTSNQDAATKVYVDGILGSATAAATSAAAAAVSESNAATSASNASTSASNAASSASAAAASYDSFDDRYLGSKTSNPSVDNDGNALLTGALYWNSTASEMRVYNGSAWVATYLPSSAYIPYVAPSTSGNVLTSNGTDWVSSAPAATLTGTTQSVSPFETSFGSGAGPSVTGVNNTLVGYNAGNAVTSGTDNTAMGWGALYSATTSIYNTAVGSAAASGLTTGSFNTGIGTSSLANMTTASDNVAVGYFAGGSIFGAQITGNKNVAVGNYALIGNLGDYNSASAENCAIGYSAMSESYTADFCVAVGAYALDGANNNLQGDYNAAIGHSAGRAISTGAQNTLLGANAAYSGTNNLTTGSNNIIIGYNAAATSATVSNQATIGNSSIATFRVPGINFYADAGSKFGWGQNTNASAASGIAFGFQANAGNSGAGNICIGDLAGRFEGGNTGGSNVFIGGSAGSGTGSSISSPYNVGIGTSALQRVAAGGYNTAVGYQAGDQITTGTNNVILGYSAASSGTNDLTTGANNVVLGFNAATSSATVSNTVTLGNSSIATLRCQVTTITALSDARDKANVHDLPAGLDFIKALRAVSFDWNMRDGGKVGHHDIGFIAQELKSAQDVTGIIIPGLVDETNPERLEAGYGKLLPVLVKAIQELSAKVDSLQAELTTLKGN